MSSLSHSYPTVRAGSKSDQLFALEMDSHGSDDDDGVNPNMIQTFFKKQPHPENDDKIHHIGDLTQQLEGDFFLY